MGDIEKHIVSMDAEKALDQLRAWVADMDTRAEDLRTTIGADTWHEWAPPFKRQFEAAANAGAVISAHRDAVKLRMVLHACQHPDLVHQIQGAFRLAGRELAQWLGN